MNVKLLVSGPTVKSLIAILPILTRKMMNKVKINNSPKKQQIIEIRVGNLASEVRYAQIECTQEFSQSLLFYIYVYLIKINWQLARDS